MAHTNLGAIERNCVRLREVIGSRTRLCAVIKANAYGHGEVCSANAALAGGADWLAVAVASEATTLRRTGIAAPTLIMGALTPEEATGALDIGADVVVWEPAFAVALADAAAAAGVTARIHVKLDTGMGRLGTKDPEQALAVADIAERSTSLELIGVMTHFATADDDASEHFDEQLTMFSAFAQRVKEQFPKALLHAANSAATLRDPSAHFDMVRCGVALYGLDPLGQDATRHGLEQAITLRSYVAAVRRFAAGDGVGYGRTWVADEPTYIGTLPIGYGDGWRRDLSSNADVLIGGRRYPLVGRVSTDNITVNLGPQTDVAPGAEATLIGADGAERITVEDVARRVGTINYDITCGITSRVARSWSHA